MTTHSNVNANYFHKKGIAKVFQFSSDAGMMENFGFGRNAAEPPPHRNRAATKASSQLKGDIVFMNATHIVRYS